MSYFHAIITENIPTPHHGYHTTNVTIYSQIADIFYTKNGNKKTPSTLFKSLSSLAFSSISRPRESSQQVCLNLSVSINQWNITAKERSIRLLEALLIANVIRRSIFYRSTS